MPGLLRARCGRDLQSAPAHHISQLNWQDISSYTIPRPVARVNYGDGSLQAVAGAADLGCAALAGAGVLQAADGGLVAVEMVLPAVPAVQRAGHAQGDVALHAVARAPLLLALVTVATAAP